MSDSALKMWQELVTKFEAQAAAVGGEDNLDPKDQIMLIVARRYLVQRLTEKISR